MTARHYRGRAGARRVIAVTAGSSLEELVAASGAYELVEEDQAAAGGEVAPPAGEEPPSSPPAAGEASPAVVDVLPPVPPAPPAPVRVDADPAAAAILTAAYAVDTAEGVNSYLDEHPYAAELVLEHERATKARKGILEGRHATPASS